MNNQNVQRFEVKVQAMSENLKTIKELADELGVSKSYIDKIIRILELHTKLDKLEIIISIKKRSLIYIN